MAIFFCLPFFSAIAKNIGGALLEENSGPSSLAYTFSQWSTRGPASRHSFPVVFPCLQELVVEGTLPLNKEGSFFS